MLFRNRDDAGQQLRDRLAGLVGPGAVVLGLPRGGVPVAAALAAASSATLDVVPVRKLGVPGHEELAFGAVAAGVRVINPEVVRRLRISEADIERVAAREADELARREAAYREGRPPAPLAGRTVVLVDDGMATGATMRAAAEAVRTRQPQRLIIAVPVGPPDVCRELAALADDLVCLYSPERFLAVGEWYQDFRPTTDDEVKAALRAAAHHDG